MIDTVDLPLYATPLEQKERNLNLGKVLRVAAGVGLIAVGVDVGVTVGSELLAGEHSFANIGILAANIITAHTGWKLIRRQSVQVDTPEFPSSDMAG